MNDTSSGQMDTSLATTAEALRGAILLKLSSHVGKRRAVATRRDWLLATAIVVRDFAVTRWHDSIAAAYDQGGKRVYYMSLEFLIGRLLFDNLNNLGLMNAMREALAGLEVDLDLLRALEPDAALGNGGLGRLAACYMESMATLGIPAYGYGIRYDHGLFRQVIDGGVQQELPEEWLAFGNPWEFERAEVQFKIGFGGHVAHEGAQANWHPAETVIALAYDTPVVGWRGTHVNTLRLWSSRPQEPLRLDMFNHGDHTGALTGRMQAEAISKVLYPSDATPAGEELRLRQEYFFTSASLQDLVRRHIRTFGDIGSLAEKTAIQLNDTHPAIAVAEMMRILVDLHAVPWDAAWGMTRSIFSYTNHTLLPEALETWPVALMERLLPRHIQIIYLINEQQLVEMRAFYPGDDQLALRVSMIDEERGRRVRMSHLAFLGSHRVNGVSALHTELMRQTVFRDLNLLRPGQIVNVTNGITFRRWLHGANPNLTRLLAETLGGGVLDQGMQLAGLREFSEDDSFQERFKEVRLNNKKILAAMVHRDLGIKIDPGALFDVHIKRIHEYKRQLLNILETVALYNAIRSNPGADWVSRVKIFAGKAAPSYYRAKLIIRLANDVAQMINNDPIMGDRLKMVFIPNYSVSLAELIIPASDLSEQISTAGMEASGTGNMKLALNGAITIGTLDGANIEIKDHVGDENIFIFGMTAAQVEARRAPGFDARATIAASAELGEVLEVLSCGVVSPGDPNRYAGLVSMLRHDDQFMVCEDFQSYYRTQRAVAALWRQPRAWWRASILNTAGMGWFSSDRSIREYADDIWRIPVRS
ncbi:MAG: glycogen/starch/alpha-glucan phosphorylase [Acidocella sp.]|nr:glycogen/starch/alpha-glucan phosphorylase [Acidocella sp.]